MMMTTEAHRITALERQAIEGALVDYQAAADYRQRVGDPVAGVGASPSDAVPAPRRLIVLVDLIWRTGLRPREVIHMRWADIDLDSGEVHITSGKYGGTSYRVLFPAGVKDRLHRLRQTALLDAYLLSNAACPYRPPEYLKSSWHRLMKRIGLPHISLYDLRHDFATQLFEMGVTTGDLAQRLRIR